MAHSLQSPYRIITTNIVNDIDIFLMVDWHYHANLQIEPMKQIKSPCCGQVILLKACTCWHYCMKKLEVRHKHFLRGWKQLLKEKKQDTVSRSKKDAVHSNGREGMRWSAIHMLLHTCWSFQINSFSCISSFFFFCFWLYFQIARLRACELQTQSLRIHQ